MSTPRLVSANYAAMVKSAFSAVTSNDFATLKALAPLISINEKNEKYFTLVCFAAWHKKWEMVEWLLEHCIKNKKEENIHDNFQLGYVLLYMALDEKLLPNQLEKWFKNLFEYHANNHVIMESSLNTPMHLIAARGNEYKEVLKILIHNDSNNHINEKNKDGKIPFDIAQEKEHLELLPIFADEGVKYKKIFQILFNCNLIFIYHNVPIDISKNKLLDLIFCNNNSYQLYVNDNTQYTRQFKRRIEDISKFGCNPFARTLLRARCAVEAYEKHHELVPLDAPLLLNNLFRSQQSITLFKAIKEEVKQITIGDTIKNENSILIESKVKCLKRHTEIFLQTAKNEDGEAVKVLKYFSLLAEKNPPLNAAVAPTMALKDNLSDRYKPNF